MPLYYHGLADLVAHLIFVADYGIVRFLYEKSLYNF
jgi:hypothetical protein